MEAATRNRISGGARRAKDVEASAGEIPGNQTRQQRPSSLVLVVVAIALALLACGSSYAQTGPAAPIARGECKMMPDWDVAVGNSRKMPAALMGVGITQRLQDAIPLNLVFRNSQGKAVRLGQYFGSKPVILSLVYYTCPMLCPLEEQGLLQSLKQLRFTAGKQFNVVTVSFNPHDTPQIAAQKRKLYLGEYGRKAALRGWYFLTGSRASITALTQAVGFHYRYDRQTHNFAHAVAIMVITPQGRLAQYFYGIRYAAGNLRLALVQASHNKIGSPVDQMILFCYHYNPVSGKYSLMFSRLLAIGGALMLLTLGGLVLILSRSSRRRASAA